MRQTHKNQTRPKQAWDVTSTRENDKASFPNICSKIQSGKWIIPSKEVETVAHMQALLMDTLWTFPGSMYSMYMQRGIKWVTWCYHGDWCLACMVNMEVALRIHWIAGWPQFYWKLLHNLFILRLSMCFWLLYEQVICYAHLSSGSSRLLNLTTAIS